MHGKKYFSSVFSCCLVLVFLVICNEMKENGKRKYGIITIKNYISIWRWRIGEMKKQNRIIKQHSNVKRNFVILFLLFFSIFMLLLVVDIHYKQASFFSWFHYYALLWLKCGTGRCVLLSFITTRNEWI